VIGELILGHMQLKREVMEGGRKLGLQQNREIRSEVKGGSI